MGAVRRARQGRAAGARRSAAGCLAGADHVYVAGSGNRRLRRISSGSPYERRPGPPAISNLENLARVDSIGAPEAVRPLQSPCRCAESSGDAAQGVSSRHTIGNRELAGAPSGIGELRQGALERGPLPPGHPARRGCRGRLAAQMQDVSADVEVDGCHRPRWDRLATWMSPASLHMDVRFLACPVKAYDNHPRPRPQSKPKPKPSKYARVRTILPEQLYS